MSIDVNAGEPYYNAWLSNEDMNVFSDGIANNTLVDQNSILTVYAGGTINTTAINGGGEVDLEGVASDTQIFTGGYFVVGRMASRATPLWKAATSSSTPAASPSTPQSMNPARCTSTRTG